MEKPERISLQNAATTLGISKATLRSWIKRYKLAPFRSGKELFFLKKDLERFKKQRESIR